jgi:hypothetical protein
MQPYLRKSFLQMRSSWIIQATLNAMTSVLIRAHEAELGDGLSGRALA